MIWNWFPWRWLIRWTTGRYGLIDPAMVLARLRRFAEPSEVAEPLEIVRAGFLFHSRGIINTRAIQHNLDWLWPYWVEKQFNPRDCSFIPRAHSISHINLTHRNWTAVGLPGVPLFPLVDPRGLVTPVYDGWSLDCWVIDADGRRLAPARADRCRQTMRLGDEHVVVTTIEQDGMALVMQTAMCWADGGPRLDIDVEARGAKGGRLAVAARPYNPEGVQFIETIEGMDDGRSLRINNRTPIHFDARPACCVLSTYAQDDVFNRLDAEPRSKVSCDVGMATGAALFDLDDDGLARVRVSVPLGDELKRADRRTHLPVAPEAGRTTWGDLEPTRPQFELPDRRMGEVFEASVRTLMLLCPFEVYPGPFTYRRFWYRDACLMLNALLAINQTAACRRLIDQVFPQRQRRSGYYESQEGEWDSNGQVLWATERFARCTGQMPHGAAMACLEDAARWLVRKRQLDDMDEPHAGLLPAGFSAEHLGPNNYFYWDNYWAVGGLRSAADLFARAGRDALADDCRGWADEHFQAIERSLKRIDPQRRNGAIPAAPNRRMDAGAIGSIVADYPLQLYPAGHRCIRDTVEFLLGRCMVKGAFFQDMTHSGMNAYLTLHLAQVLLRAGDGRYADLVERVAELASPTGHWPEAIHPLTETGCMGDGEHGWAAAEWVLMIRSLFVREEGDDLVVGSGLHPEWLASEHTLKFGPTATAAGTVTVTITGPADRRILRIDGQWSDRTAVTARLRGYPSFDITEPGHEYPLLRSQA